ncbi:hypothetical protein PENDEC_c004G03774 [Penicillium decumbens]|uniref:Uncharacterized protein n=1 Tax=Penicillium decumbens TaxID=69771 RepID=A0A1V6PI42_PENDC|nr:hypothetical protein PENDEC_c004G03774 [Penicillium decumbens]
MAPAKMPIRADEEMGKKDDDLHSSQARFHPAQSRMYPRPRRILIAVFALVLLYQFFKHMPTDVAPAAERYNPTIARLRHPSPSQSAPAQSPALSKADAPPLRYVSQTNGDEKESFEGEIKFYELPRSLPRNKHPERKPSHAVLFAGSNLHSISDMVPLACQMAGKRLSHVHFVLMGKDQVSVEGIKTVNGVSDADCPITWHDGRPDHLTESSDARMERSVPGGLGLIQAYVAPEVIITQDKNLEDSFFWNGLEAHKRKSGIPHIALPSPSRDLMWMSFVDSTALKVWNDIRVDMVVHASKSSGSLIRLIRSLDAADYLGSIPSLTIELPPSLDPQSRGILQNLQGLSQLAGRITLRRRIDPRYMDPADSSLRTVEDFYPMNPRLSHLLMLCPQTEVAPSFYHYLKYSILRYKQSARAKQTSMNLMGISLELPVSKPTTDKELFIPPAMLSTDAMEKTGPHSIPTFLWQMPSSNAALFFGDKWSEFHSFLSSRLGVAESRTNIASQDKIISKKYPAFMEYLLELMRAKGYYMLYPSFPGHTAASLVTVHHDLYHPPEEYAHEVSLNTGTKPVPEIDNPDEPLEPLVDDVSGMSSEKPLNGAPTIMRLLRLFESGLPDAEELSLLSYDGEELAPETYYRQSREYAEKFRLRYGHCTEESIVTEGPGLDLFCLD